MGKQYKDLSINGKINAKSWGFWRLPNTKGFVMTMIDNTKSFNDADGKPRTDYADFMRHTLIEEYTAEAPKANVIQKDHIHNIYGITRPFKKFVILCQEIAREQNTMMEVKDYPQYGWASVAFMTDKFGGVYVSLHYDHKTRDVVNWFGHDGAVQLESVEQLKNLVKTEKEKLLQVRDLNKVYAMVNAEY